MPQGLTTRRPSDEAVHGFHRRTAAQRFHGVVRIQRITDARVARLDVRQGVAAEGQGEARGLAPVNSTRNLRGMTNTCLPPTLHANQ